MDDDYELTDIPEQDVKQLIRNSIKNLSKSEITDFIHEMLFYLTDGMSTEEVIEIINKCNPNEF